MHTYYVKRDLELIRLILLEVERFDANQRVLNSSNVRLRGYTDLQIAHHIFLAVAERLVDGIEITGIDSEGIRTAIVTEGLTGAGHDFLETMRRALLIPDSALPVRTALRGESVDDIFEHGPDYTVVFWRGSSYTLTRSQRALVRLLDEERLRGRADVSLTLIRAQPLLLSCRVPELFRRANTSLWGPEALVYTGTRLGTYRLNL